MPITLDEYKLLKTRVEECERKASRAEGAYEEAMKQLKSFGYDSIEDAQLGLNEMKKKLAEAEERYEKELKAFKEKWGDVLDI